MSVDNAAFPDSMNANFDCSEAERILGQPLENSYAYTVRQTRTSKEADFVVFTASAGGSIGDCHGRWTVIEANNWVTGETIEFLSFALYKV